MITINQRSNKSIFEQIVFGIKQLIYIGVLKEDEKLPSVRDLASQLIVNPNTVSKAYLELERSGMVYSVSGKGTYVATTEAKYSKAEAGDAIKKIEEGIEAAIISGMTSDELEKKMGVSIKKIFSKYERKKNDKNF